MVDRALKELGPTATYKQLFDKIQELRGNSKQLPRMFSTCEDTQVLMPDFALL